MQRREEIPSEELHRCAAELRQALEHICQSPAFRTSPKSCAFLRHIVHHTLDGQIDALKERLIGMTLLGRNASYDTGADAGVRVRANDVRKRLIAYSETTGADQPFSVELPAGSYVPRFFRQEWPVSPAACLPHPGPVSLMQEEPAPRLSLQRLSMPTVVALFLCIVCLRWEVGEEHPFNAFWQDVFQNHRAVLYLPPLKTQAGGEAIAMEQFKAALPLFNLAGQFHNLLTVVDTIEPSPAAGDLLLLLGTAQGVPSEQTSLAIENTPSGRKIVDRSASDARLPVMSRAALLTIVNGDRRYLHIEGTDEQAVSSAVEMLSERATFPEGLADALVKGSVTQIVFPLSPRGQPIVFYEPLAMAQLNPERHNP